MTAAVSLHGNRYQVESELVGHKVELVFDPFDLTFLRVRLDGKDARTATPFQIERHTHPKARPGVPAEEPKVTTGIDYLGLVDNAHSDHLGQKINYADLAEPAADSVDLTQPSHCHLPKRSARLRNCRPTMGSSACSSAATWRPACCTGTTPTTRPSPASPGASPNAPSAWSPGRSAPARPSRSAPAWTSSTRPHTPSATSPTP
ncbi:Mu transposase C-terminal domain-containing protein [Streptomyces sp. NPDC003480]